MEQFDYIVVGGGLAGLYTAYHLAPLGRVALVARASLSDSNSYFAQGGVAAVVEESDSPHNHFEDTIEAGRGLCDPVAVELLTEEAPRRIEELIAMGMQFDEEGGRLALGLEGGHHHKRILHAGGDATGRMLSTFMIEQVSKEPRITVLDEHLVVGLLALDNRCYGIHAYNERQHSIDTLFARATVLALGGAAALYKPTTNPPTALGDGIALAMQVGARLRDLEFIQFHPTALYLPGVPSFLISEAVRGEGAYLLDAAGKRFMQDKHPLAELAPRDVVAAEIFKQIAKDGTGSVTLELSHIPRERLLKRFPTIAAHCEAHGVDFTQRIPVAPAAHYTVGGIATDLDGTTSVERLYAVGELASTGVMGANRLASNSLVECLVFGKRIAEALAATHRQALPLPDSLPGVSIPLATRSEEESWRRDSMPRFMGRLGRLLMSHVGILRQKDQLQTALAKIEEMEQELLPVADKVLFARLTLGRLAVSKAITASALGREESRGGHRREDFPETLPPTNAYHTIVERHNIYKQPI